MNSFSNFLVASSLLIGLSFSNSIAQWSSDPLQNLAIADTTNEQVTPKMAPTSDGGCYISWFDNRNGNYSVYLQRLNSLGEFQFPRNGLLISDHPQDTWITDYDLTVDPADNAILVFNDIRNGGSSGWDIFAYKISPQGNFEWGPDGIGLSDITTSDFEVAPKVTTTPDSQVTITWYKSGTMDQLALQRLSSSGQKLWGEYGITLTPAANYRLSAPDLVAADGDSVILVYKNSTGPFWAPTTHIYTQKFSPQGDALWNPNGVLIYNLGDISAWSDPLIYPDGAGGAFYTWYDAHSLSEFNVWVQHVSAKGELIFPLNGIKASTNTSRLHMYPTLTFLPTNNELFVFWIEENYNQNQYGIYGQKFSHLGDRLWTDSGKQFWPMGGNTITFLRSTPADTNIYLSYFESSAPNAFNAAVKVACINSDGNYMWDQVIASSATLGNKDDLQMITNTEQKTFLVWDDKRHDGGDIYAQNVNPNGSLGNVPTDSRLNQIKIIEGFSLAQNYPNPFNPITMIEFSIPQNCFINLKVFNLLGEEIITLVNQHLPAGKYSYEWNASNLASGIYLFRLQAEQNSRQKFEKIKKMMTGAVGISLAGRDESNPYLNFNSAMEFNGSV